MPQTVPGRLPHGCKIKRSDAESIAESIESTFSSAANRTFTIARRGNIYTESTLAGAWDAARKPGATNNLKIDITEGSKSANFTLDESGVRWSATGDGHFPAGLNAEVANILGDATEGRHVMLFSQVARISPLALLAEAVAAFLACFAWPSHRTLIIAIAAFTLAVTAGWRWYSQWQLKSSVTFDPGSWTPWNRSDRINAIILIVAIASLVVSIVALVPDGDSNASGREGIPSSTLPEKSPSETSDSVEASKSPHISIRGNCTEETMNSPLSVISGGFTPGQPYTVSVFYPNGQAYHLDGTVGTVNANGTVNSKWNCLNSLPNGTYVMKIKDNATGKIASTTFAVDFPSASQGSSDGIAAHVAWTNDGGGGGSASTLLRSYDGPDAGHRSVGAYNLGDALTVECKTDRGAVITVGPSYTGPNPHSVTWYRISGGTWVPAVYTKIDKAQVVPAC
ncbi:hypothetical protein [Streptomyces sp. NPDC001642]|uniref:hypothetical protein n=1 Tax=Streptomyces sp. NPDC001642 TaxID=3154392 RepID=UPI0033324984